MPDTGAEPTDAAAGKSPLLMLSVGALGVVFGDIGTSPLYAMRAVFESGFHIPLTSENVIGVLSLILWSLVLMVTVKYVFLMMAADNKGEGGIMALLSLSRRLVRDPRKQTVILTLGLLGAAMFYGDSMITPAVTVLSAVEGLEVATTAFSPYVTPIALAVLIALFMLQRGGTGGLARWFGPVMCLWFAVLAISGIAAIVERPEVLAAASPHHAIGFFLRYRLAALLALGMVVLVITGAEALYADMGHFGRKAIRMAWLYAVLPALVLNYFGQGALLLEDPAALRNPFFLMFPNWLLAPVILLATVASIIASQAVISGAFSLTRQAMQIDLCPRMDVIYTSEHTMGQIYVPVINWMLFAAVVCLVLIFHRSSNLASAYGLAVTATVMVDTLLFLIVLHRMWRWAPAAVVAFGAYQLTLDGAFLASTSTRIGDGGWFPLLIGTVLYLLLSTWQRGRVLLREKREAETLELDPLLDFIVHDIPMRVPGTAIFFTTSQDKMPRSFMHNLKHNKVLHEQVILLTIQTADVPYVSQEERIAVTPIRHEFYRVTVRYGYMDNPNLPVDLADCKRFGLDFDPAMASYFLSRETLIVPSGGGIRRWRRRLFTVLSRVATSSARSYKLPTNQVMELGTQISL